MKTSVCVVVTLPMLLINGRVNAVDISPPQVRIESRIIEVSHSKWLDWSGHHHLNPPNSSTNSALQVGGTFSKSQADSLLGSIRSDHIGKILVGPTTITKPNAQARFSEGQLQLVFVPSIKSDGSIEMKVTPVKVTPEYQSFSTIRVDVPKSQTLLIDAKVPGSPEHDLLIMIIPRIVESRQPETPRQPSTPTPSRTDKVTDALRTIGSSISIDIGGGIGGGDHRHGGEDRHRTADKVSTDKTKTHTTSPTTTHKTVTSACKCHPCTCSPCTCH